MLRDLKTEAGRLRQRAPEAPAEAPKVDETADESALVGAFIGRVGVDPVRGSHLVDVTFTAEDPKFAAEAVNTLVDEYVSENLEIKLRSTQGMLDWLDKELENQQKRVEESEKALAEYREKENALSLDDKQNIVLSRLNQLNDAATKARTARVQKESLYNQVKSISSGTAPDAIPMIAQNPTVQDRKSKLAELQREKVKLLERYGEQHPAGRQHQRQPQRRAAAARPRARAGGPVGPQRVRDRACSKSRRSRRTSKAPRPKRPT